MNKIIFLIAGIIVLTVTLAITPYGSSMRNQAELTRYLISNNLLQNTNIINAFLTVDRIDFVLDYHKDNAYEDIALPIGSNQTISQPAVVATMLELLDPKEGEKILDIGSGSGWTTALLGECVGTSGQVYATELEPDLYMFGLTNVSKYSLKNVYMTQATPHKLGMPEEGPFDRILVSATSEELPSELIPQFTKRLVIPIRNSIWVLDKKGDTLSKRIYDGYVFVPLIK